MTEKTIQDGGMWGQDTPKLPESKAVTQLSRGARVYENQGRGGDITVIGFRLDELKPAYIISAYAVGKDRILSSISEGTHTRNSSQIAEYGRMKGLDGLWDFMQAQIKGVRVNLSLEGPDRIYSLDSKPDDEKGLRAAKVLEDLGVDKKHIKFDPREFHSLVVG
ncbi:MAG: hypothetical protein PHG85_01020 [Candidatus Altiarchaeota archaeon]|nr:hypothetical protein [Candidatus Altiarchaeota archaeon]